MHIRISAMVTKPVYIVVLFLAVTGLSFWSVVQVEVNPREADVLDGELDEASLPKRSTRRSKRQSGNDGVIIWNDWSTCSVSCNGGLSIREGFCPAKCEGKDIVTEEGPCNIQSCNRIFHCRVTKDGCPEIMLDKGIEDFPKWKILHGQGDTKGTGPSDEDYYFYAEADRKPGDKTNMSSVDVPATEPSYCLIFSYHMYGEDMGELSVQLISDSQKEEIFNKSGNQGDFWYTYNVTFYLPNLHGQNFFLVFEATQGNGIKGDIAIKNILLYHGRCGKWKPWGTWSLCNMSDCKRKRTRECEGGNVCEGPTADFEGCTNCTYTPEWEKWTSWSRTICDSEECGKSTSLIKRIRICRSGTCDGNSTEQKCLIDGRCDESLIPVLDCPFSTECDRLKQFIRNSSGGYEQPLELDDTSSTSFRWVREPRELRGRLKTGRKNGQEYHMYADVSRGHRGDMAILRTNPGVQPTKEKYCLRFYHTVYDPDAGSLKVNINSEGQTFSIFNYSGQQAQAPDERNQIISVNSREKKNFTIDIIAVKGRGGKGGQAIDEVFFHEGPCKTECGAWNAWSCDQPNSRPTRSRNCSGPYAGISQREVMEVGNLCATDWDPWPPCSVTCGNGYQNRKRVCRAHLPCTFITENFRICTVNKPCDSMCKWSKWGPCNETCYNRFGVQERSCNSSGFKTAEKPCRGRNESCDECGNWTEYNMCSRNCGPGNRTRYRRCTSGEQQDSVNCEPPKPSCTGDWASWGGWSLCSATCGQGRETRSRYCVPSNCIGRNNETRTCRRPHCPCVWAPWLSWMSCTVSCGEGTMERQRSLQNGPGVCVPTLSETKTCANKTCPEWGPWTRWTCDVTCANGTKSRYRNCRGSACVGHRMESELCTLAACPKWSLWSRWTCDVTCGSGTNSRHRNCTGTGCVGHSRESEICRLTSCFGNWGMWSSWSGCRVTCGQGNETRSRNCIQANCIGPNNDMRPCSRGICYLWGPWSEWTCPCRKGKKLRYRNCNTGTGCTGICIDDADCMFTAWSQWSFCSRTCGIGQMLSYRSSLNATNCERETTTKTCFDSICGGSHATDWGECSASCGFGIQTHDNGYGGIESRQCFIRECIGKWNPWSHWTCPCRNGERLRFRNCRGQICYGQDTDRLPCAWGDWSRWSSCLASCGIGERRRYRYPPSETNCDMQVKTEQCMLRACRDIFWTVWGPCSATCRGIQSRTLSTGSWSQTESRPCGQNNCNVPIILIEDFQANEWSDWTPCSSSCGLGTQMRERRNRTDSRQCILSACIGSWNIWESWNGCNIDCNNWRFRVCQGDLCVGSFLNITDCPSCPAYYSEWSEWGDCNATCNESHRNRTRKCIHGNCLKKTDIKNETCNRRTCDGKHGPWSDWSSCSKTCNEGGRVRKRVNLHSNKSIEEKGTCNPHNCPGVWGQWSQWVGCDCSTGIKERRRQCNEPEPRVCGHDSVDKELCSSNECPWGEWSNWDCKASCGQGVAVRTRKCPLDGCQGKTFQSKSCSADPCNGVWNDWSRWVCSVTCDTGISMRNRSCPGSNCQGNSQETRTCGTPNTCSFVWGAWQDWTHCPNCGMHYRTRKRVCDSGTCPNNYVQFENCNKETCGLWSNWENMTCDATCGMAIGTYKRQCRTPPCHGDEVKYMRCNDLEDCPGNYTKWFDWSAWSATCGARRRTRMRACSTNSCSGNNTETQTDTVTPC